MNFNPLKSIGNTGSLLPTEKTNQSDSVKQIPTRESLTERIKGIEKNLIYCGQKVVRTVTKRNKTGAWLSVVPGLIDRAKNNEVKEAGNTGMNVASFDEHVVALKAGLSFKAANLKNLKHDCDKAAKQLLDAYKETGDQRLLALYGGLQSVGNKASEALKEVQQAKVNNFLQKAKDVLSFSHKKINQNSTDTKVQQNLQNTLSEDFTNLIDQISPDATTYPFETQAIILGEMVKIGGGEEVSRNICRLCISMNEKYMNEAKGDLNKLGIDLTSLSHYEDNIEDSLKINSEPRPDFKKALSTLDLQLTNERYDELKKLRDKYVARGNILNSAFPKINSFNNATSIELAGFRMMVEKTSHVQLLFSNLVTNLGKIENPGELVPDIRSPKEIGNQMVQCYKNGLEEIITGVLEDSRQINLFRMFINSEPQNVDSEKHQNWEAALKNLSAQNFLNYLNRHNTQGNSGILPNVVAGYVPDDDLSDYYSDQQSGTWSTFTAPIPPAGHNIPEDLKDYYG